MADTVSAAIIQAQASGRPVPIGGLGLVANPDGSVGTAGGGFRGNQLTQTLPPITAPVSSFLPWAANAAPDRNMRINPSSPPASQIWNQNNPVGTETVTPSTAPASTGVQPASFFSDRLASARPPAFQIWNPNNPVGTQALTPSTASTPSVAQQAAAYRAATMRPSLTTDQLNAQSLAAAQAGRNFWNPALNVQPGGQVLNALVTPPVGAPALATQPPWQSAAVQPVYQQPLEPSS